ncbi:MAG: toprim domain-containing protein, partial [Pseudomonadota bacterium]
PIDGEGGCQSYCNAIPTPDGGSHESGLRTGLVRALKGFGEMTSQRRAQTITAEDAIGGAEVFLSVFLRDPSFQGQTKERLATPEATRLVDTAIKDPLDHWLSEDAAGGAAVLTSVVERAEDRLRRRQARDLARKTATRKLRLPGKLADCSQRAADGTEIFLVEGESAGGSAKAARNRETQAVLPLRGKILNVASASVEKLAANQEIADLKLALGCGIGRDFDITRLRYERVIIMTDADVDGAHIAALLLTFFYRQMPGLITEGHLFLAQPPLYRLQQGGTVAYARDDAHKDELMQTQFTGRGKIEISRFKGLGEMPAKQLRQTTMDMNARTLWQVVLESAADGGEGPGATRLVEDLMGRKPESRLKFIQKHAPTVSELDI